MNVYNSISSKSKLILVMKDQEGQDSFELDLWEPMMIINFRGQPVHFLVDTMATYLLLQEPL